MQKIMPADPRLTWQGAISLEQTEHWVKPWRLPQDRLDLFPHLRNQASNATGVRIAFYSDTRRLTGQMVPEPSRWPKDVDLLVDGRFTGHKSIDDDGFFVFEDLPAADKLTELWLPLGAEVKLRHLAIDSGATLGPVLDGRPHWVVYGGSNAACVRAESPSKTWPALVAQRLNLNLTCLGFDGNCHFEPNVARMIRDIPADAITVYAGLNVFGQSSMSERTWQPVFLGFVQIVREKHPDIPIVILTPISSTRNLQAPNKVGLTRDKIIGQIEQAVQILHNYGDECIWGVDGKRIFPPELTGLLVDGLHPNGEGYKLMADYYMKQVVKPLQHPFHQRMEQDTSAERRPRDGASRTDFD